MTDELLPALPDRAASYHVSYFRQDPGMRNTEFQEAADFTEGSHSLYTADQLRAYASEAIRLSHTWPTLRDEDAMTDPHLEGLIREAFGALCVLQGALIANRDDPRARDGGGYQSGYAVADGHTATRLTPIIETLQAALAALPGGGVDGWKPIESCPRWKRVLLWMPEMTGFAPQAWIGKRLGGDSRNYGYDESWQLATPFSQLNKSTGINQQVWVNDVPDPLAWMPMPDDFTAPTPNPHEADQ